MPDDRLVESQRNLRIACVALVLLLYFGTVGAFPLGPPDEARYAEIPREMLERGDFITPTLNYVKYFEKPPLGYWLTAGAFAALGQRESVARLWPAVFALLGVWGVYAAGRRLYGEGQGLAAGVVLAASPLWFVAGHLNHVDPVLSSLLTLCLLSFFAFEVGPGAGRRRWLVGFYALAGLATLAKGLIGVVLPAAVVAVYWICTGRLGCLRRIGLAWGVPLYLAITAPWFAAVSSRNPDFAWFFFVHEHWVRFTGDVHGRTQDFWYLPVAVFVGFLPFVPYLVPAIRAALREGRRPRGAPRAELFLVVWAVVIFLFFWSSRSQLPFYVLPVFPPLALLVGRFVADPTRAGTGCCRRADRAAAGALLGLAGALLGFAWVGPAVRGSSASLWPLALATLLGAALAWRVAPRRPWRAPGALPVALTALVMLTGILATGQALIAEERSSRELAWHIERFAEPHEQVVHFQQYHQDATFYSARRSVVVGYKGELEFGHDRASDAAEWFWSCRRFLEEWRRGRPLWVIVSRRRLAIPAPGTHGRPLGEALGRYVQVAESGDRVLLTNARVGLARR